MVMGSSKKKPNDGLGSKGKDGYKSHAFERRTMRMNKDMTSAAAFKGKPNTSSVRAISATKAIDEQFAVVEASRRRERSTFPPSVQKQASSAVPGHHTATPRHDLAGAFDEADTTPTPKGKKSKRTISPLTITESWSTPTKVPPLSARALLGSTSTIPSKNFYGSSNAKRLQRTPYTKWAPNSKGSSFNTYSRQSTLSSKSFMNSSSGTLRWGTKDRTVGGGFRNVGNTCYLNAVLQALLVVEPFVESLRHLGKELVARLQGDEPTPTLVLDDDGGVTEETEETEDKPDPKVLTSLVDLITKLDRRKDAQQVIDPSEVKRSLAKTIKSFEGWGQQDAHEFLTFLLDQLHQETSVGAADDALGPVPDTFKCVVKHTRTCQQCHDSTTIEEKYLELSVDIPPHLQTEVPSMEVLLEAFCQAETVEYKCEQCEHDVSTYTHEIVSLPRCLIITLKRFSYDFDTNQRIKQRVPVNIQRQLSLALLPSPQPHLESCVAAKASQPKAFDSKLNGSTLRKVLFQEAEQAKEEAQVAKVEEESLLGLSVAEISKMDAETQLRYTMLKSKAESPAKQPDDDVVVIADEETPDSGPRAGSAAKRTDFQLMAVTRHSGTASAGHYICDAFDLATGQWRTFDDSIINKKTWSEVKSRAQRDAYLLFFIHSSSLPREK